MIHAYYFNFQARSIGANGFNGIHSLSQIIEQRDMKIQILPALQDNYMYLVCRVFFFILIQIQTNENSICR